MIYRSAADAAEVESRYLELLRSWPVPKEALTVPTREGETFVVASGSSTHLPSSRSRAPGPTRLCGCLRSNGLPVSCVCTPWM
jgi:hypothetical protein